MLVSLNVQSPPTAVDVTNSALDRPNDPLGQQFEQMIWTQMLKHAGLEKSLSSGHAEGASAFARFMVEAIAEDIAAIHPLGLGDLTLRSDSSSNSQLVTDT